MTSTAPAIVFKNTVLDLTRMVKSGALRSASLMLKARIDSVHSITQIAPAEEMLMLSAPLLVGLAPELAARNFALVADKDFCKSVAKRYAFEYDDNMRATLKMVEYVIKNASEAEKAKYFAIVDQLVIQAKSYLQPK
jgi:hypothetical protein